MSESESRYFRKTASNSSTAVEQLFTTESGLQSVLIKGDDAKAILGDKERVRLLRLCARPAEKALTATSEFERKELAVIHRSDQYIFPGWGDLDSREAVEGFVEGLIGVNGLNIVLERDILQLPAEIDSQKKNLTVATEVVN
jgi:hypothetical protein